MRQHSDSPLLEVHPQQERGCPPRSNADDPSTLRNCRQHLALWCTLNFLPIMDHVQLESVLSKVGFVALPISGDRPLIAAATRWREYEYKASGQWRRRLREGQEAPAWPRLPYPAINGLHIVTYNAFIDAVEFFLGRDASHIFHVRAMPLDRTAPADFEWCKMVEDETCRLYYRRGTIHVADISRYNRDKERAGAEGDGMHERLKMVWPRGETSNGGGGGGECGDPVPLKNINSMLVRGYQDDEC
ncbi:hypothetical protein SAY86_004764 [Trapa natans]|uniref:Uncharacterized protein n=1 Tax=Trapa natans TaxID=22666 RepID=A0AAN7RI83_TRANT|nr:hypothetical protein SAY86_004764 [Trapa natans]